MSTYYIVFDERDFTITPVKMIYYQSKPYLKKLTKTIWANDDIEAQEMVLQFISVLSNIPFSK